MREGDRTLNEVLDAVAAHFAMSREELLSGRGQRRSRRVVMYLALRVTRKSLSQIGARFGGMSSTNVLVGSRIIERAMAEDAGLAAEVEGIKASLLIK